MRSGRSSAWSGREPSERFAAAQVARGHLTLIGYARDQAESAAALEDAAGLSGVVEVTNRIAVR